MKSIILTFALSLSLFGLELNKQAPLVVLSGKNGGYINGEAWSSNSLKKKVSLVLYMDPDKKSSSQLLINTLKQNSFKPNFQTVAIVNLKATWLPNIVIEKKLKSKQKSLKNTTYVLDKTKYLIKKWGLKDNDINALLFNKSGKLIYKHSGNLSQKDVAKIVALIKQNS